MQSLLNLKILEKNIVELPSELQREVINFVDFLKFKNKNQQVDDLSQEEKVELRKRLAFARKNPEKLLSKKDVLKKIEKTLGRKIQIKS